MIGGVLLVLAIYLLLNAAFLRVVPLAEMAGDPFVAATAAARLFGPTGDTVIRIVMLLSLIAAVNALLLMASRVPFAMSRDRLLPAFLHSREFGRHSGACACRQHARRARVHRHEHVRYGPGDAGVPLCRQLCADLHRALHITETRT